MKRNSNKRLSPKIKVLLKKKFSNMMIATFTKLLDIKIVANKRSESFFNSRILLSAACLFSSILPTSVGEREKNAISEAETKPEQPNNNTDKTRAIVAPKSGE